MTAIEHEPHVGDRYDKRIDRNRILIVGHSHHTEDGDNEDSSALTIETVAAAAQGKMQIYPFFARQPRYLGLSLADYWRDVALINFAPSSVGNKRYARMSEAQRIRGRSRFIEVIERHKPTHIFVLTPEVRFGTDLPKTNEEKRGQRLAQVGVNARGYEWGHLSYNGGRAIVACLEHPQSSYVTSNEMQAAFSTMLALRP